VEEILHDYYNQNVFSHPLYQSYPDSLKYSLLIALRFANESRTKLYATNEAIMREVTTFRCEGIGRDVGYSMIRPLYRPNIGEDQAIRLGSYMLAGVKLNVPGCGGPSLFVLVPHEGVAELKTATYATYIEHVYGWFGQCIGEFFLGHMCDAPESFEDRLSKLNGQARHLRNLWVQFTASPTDESKGPLKFGSQGGWPT
jgi:hypothetical protein